LLDEDDEDEEFVSIKYVSTCTFDVFSVMFVTCDIVALTLSKPLPRVTVGKTYITTMHGMHRSFTYIWQLVSA